MGASKKLEGKTAVITGGTTGIGLATAKLFVSEGAYVFITGRRRKELDEAVEAIGSNVAGIQGDVAKLADLDRLYETVKTRGNMDVLFANARRLAIEDRVIVRENILEVEDYLQAADLG
jgi:NAD(P)-dependent dehydrogenase (short-subunit alcohol dehydrogenase family)